MKKKDCIKKGGFIKKIASSFVIAALAPLALADNGPGCGPGAELWKGKTGLFAHSSAGTTNGTFFSPFAGLISGTSGCDNPGVVSNDYQQQVFVALNMDDLAQDVAKGNGHHISSMATLMGIEPVDHEAFFKLSQENYGTIFKSDSTDVRQVLNALSDLLMQDSQLSRYVDTSS